MSHKVVGEGKVQTVFKVLRDIGKKAHNSCQQKKMLYS